jgi:hypothetical protein
MIGISGGLMAVIHLILKYPIIGVLGFVAILAGEVNGYQVTGQVSYEQIAFVKHETERIVTEGISMGTEFIHAHSVSTVVTKKPNSADQAYGQCDIQTKKCI